MSMGSRPYSAAPSGRWAAPGYFPRWLGALSVQDRRALLLFGDLLVVALSARLVSAIASDGPRLAVLLTIETLITLAALYSADQYTLEAYAEPAVLRAIVAGVVGTMVVAMLIAAPAVVIPALCLTACLSLMALLITRPLMEKLLTAPVSRRRTLLVCSDLEAAAAHEEIRRHPQAGLDPRSATGSETGREYVLGLQALESASPILDLLERPLLDLPGLYERLSQRVPVRHVDDRWFVERFTWHRGLGYNVAKRVLDLAFALLGLVLTLPVLPVIALAICLGDRGPLLYSQERVGLNGRLFKVYKFRTMRCDAERDGAVWARPDDDRVTKVGRFLRQSRLDELPQLFNVLRGDMSLVGPRPERPEFVSELSEAIPFYQRRHMVLPGVTGWAQVRFPYGSSIQDAEEKLKYDLYYLKHRSLRFDLLILLRTVSVVLCKTGAR